ncbi:unnamed protein product [Prorocentrum cordatum]|uniref:SGNH domain-containing protein n=1 Tax=Prorocentrum cordatum TaxID=2364126 RepID=A0ABN9U9R6_9DINO|nr:unnamed protein product [Polarella glacialis]
MPAGPASNVFRCSILLTFLFSWAASLLLPEIPADVRMTTFEKNRPFPDRECNSTGWSSLHHGALAHQYSEMLVRMQGKRVLFGGDSLMDMVYHPFICSAAAFGWSISDVPVGLWGSRADESAGTQAKMFTKENHKPIVVAYMRFYNYHVGMDNIKPVDVFRFPLKPPNFDVVFLNMAHNAMFTRSPKLVQDLTNELIRHANEATHIGRVVFLGHPPQHFKTETGEYNGPETGDCACHNRAALERQQIFQHNSLVEAEVAKDNERSDGKCAFANPWSYYADLCGLHGHLQGQGWGSGDIDCTHFPEDAVAKHAPFLEDLLATAGV